MSLRLPPILCISYRNSISGCSKALRGLSVQSRVMGIFTHTSISPSPLLRQRPSRYAIRAGRNLPDKEFRYLRTVIVTAAVYWGFNSMLSYSKALRGLSVQSRVASIFTRTTTSPDLQLRQCPSHYAIRAGQNLPDKEFRYLRTVIVTAAVYWGLSSHLRLR